MSREAKLEKLAAEREKVMLGGGEKKIAEGNAMKFAYRVVIHNGSTETAEIAAMYADYATPVRIQAE